MRNSKSRFAERLEALGHKDYRSYLNSPHWKKFRARILRHDKVCLCCGGPPTEVHHKRYKRLGEEKAADAVSLCRRCHEKIHETHRREKIVLGDFARVARIVRREHGFDAPVSSPASSLGSSPPLSLREKRRRRKAKRLRREMRASNTRTVAPTVAAGSSVEDLPLFAMRFVIAASLNSGKTLDRIRLEMRCSREHLDRVTCWLSKHSLASIAPDRPHRAAEPARRPKGLRRLLDKHRT